MGLTRNRLGRAVHDALGKRRDVPRVVWQRYPGLRSILGRLYKAAKIAPQHAPTRADIDNADAVAVAVGFWILHDTNEGRDVPATRIEAWGALDEMLRRARTAERIMRDERADLGLSMTGTMTGRLASNRPNFSALPRAGSAPKSRPVMRTVQRLDDPDGYARDGWSLVERELDGWADKHELFADPPYSMPSDEFRKLTGVMPLAGPKRTARDFARQILGKHADLLIVDDPVRDDD